MAVAGLAPLFMLLVFGCFFGVAIVATIFWVWMLIDAIQNEPSEGNDKLIWVLVLLFTHMIGALIYFFVRKSKRPPRRSV